MKLIELAEIIEKYPDVKTLVAEIKAADNGISTIEDLTEYLFTKTLLPCPFCGGVANVCNNIEKNNYIINEKTRYAVRCSVGCFAMTNKYKTEKEAIEAWNKRM